MGSYEKYGNGRPQAQDQKYVDRRVIQERPNEKQSGDRFSGSERGKTEPRSPADNSADRYRPEQANMERSVDRRDDRRDERRDDRREDRRDDRQFDRRDERQVDRRDDRQFDRRDDRQF